MSWESKGSGVILDEGMVSDLVRCSLTSSGIIGKNLELNFRAEKMDLKIIQSLLERVQIHKNAGKPNNLWDLKDFSEEQQAV